MVEVLKLLAAVMTLYHFLGPWGSLALFATIVGAGIVLYTQGDRLLEWFIHRQVRGVAQVMRDAKVTIHSVTAAPAPDASVWRTGDDEEDDAFEEQLEASGMPEGDYEWYKIDATIEPRPDAEGEPAVWEPMMIQLRKNDGAARHALELDFDCLLAQFEHWHDSRFFVFDHGYARRGCTDQAHHWSRSGHARCATELSRRALRTRTAPLRSALAESSP